MLIASVGAIVALFVIASLIPRDAFISYPREWSFAQELKGTVKTVRRMCAGWVTECPTKNARVLTQHFHI